jgi:hypothetical protein
MSVPAEEVKTSSIITDEMKAEKLNALPAPVQIMIGSVNGIVAEHNDLVAQIHASEPANLTASLDQIVEDNDKLSEHRVTIAGIKDLLDEAMAAARAEAMQYLPQALNAEDKVVAQTKVKELRAAAGKSANVFSYVPQMFPGEIDSSDIDFITTHLIKPLNANGRQRSASSINTDGPTAQRPRVQDVFINGTRVEGGPKLDKDTKEPLKDDEGNVLTHSRFSDAARFVTKQFGVSLAVSEFPKLFETKNKVSDFGSCPESDSVEYTGTNKDGEEVTFTIGYTKAVS